MIPKEHIIEWKASAPWNEMVMIEQDLIICRALIAIYNNDYLSSQLAFRGGTALHKLYLSPQLRYSEDIDLVQINSGNIGSILDELRKVLSFLGNPISKQKRNNNTLIFKVNSTFPPIVAIRLKIEINCKEHFAVLGYTKIPFDVKSRWFDGSCKITTYKLDELVGTKLRALYQRKKGRDLFDLQKALENPNLNTDNVVKCYREYIEFSDGQSPSQTVFLTNMEEKMLDSFFLNDTKALLRPSHAYNPQEAYEIVQSKLIKKI
jgi:predicted nucleotidyltransferase component of viral defense system